MDKNILFQNLGGVGNTELIRTHLPVGKELGEKNPMLTDDSDEYETTSLIFTADVNEGKVH